MIGQTLSHYRITAALGAGGMGEVYRATDTSLGRDVAIKVLPPEVACDPERLARFKREAHLLASLNHPHIAAIYGLEESDGKPFLALELVEGEDLKQRLERGAIPVQEALEIARQVAEAVEEAHNKGIVHRDLKPANVKLTADGRVKVLDFGLAKAWAGHGSDGSSGPAALSQSPTLAHTGTVAGVILGTAAYMSPEQARGKPVDRRADVWSFGVLLWEMLTGQSLFAGDTVTDVIAAVVTREPDLEVLPKATPPAVRRLLSRCLRKDPRTRLPDIGAARLDLQDVLAGSAEEAMVAAPGQDARASAEVRRLARHRWAWAAAFLLAAGTASYALLARPGRPPDTGPVGRFVLELPPDRSLSGWGAPIVSPDGRRLVFDAATSDDRSSLWVRSLDSLTSRELAGTENANLPFWSPDGQSIAFFGNGELRRISLADGASQKICSLPSPGGLGGDWGRDGTILFSTGGVTARLYTVSASGGEPRAVVTGDAFAGEDAQAVPYLLPDGRHYLYMVFTEDLDRRGLYLASLDAPLERRRLLPALTRATYADGHLLFGREGTLLAQALDVSHGRLTGEPVAIASSVATWREFGADWAWFSAAAPGVLAYASETPSTGSELAWFDRKGTRIATVPTKGMNRHIALSPDERQVAVEFIAPGDETADVWTIDLARGVGTRQTFDKAYEYDPMWSLDGRELVFVSNRDGKNRLYRRSLQGGQPERPFFGKLENLWPESWSADGKALIVQNGKGVVALPWDERGDPETIIEGNAQLDEPQVSPDGRWLAYISLESARWEVYVEPFHREGQRVRVSTDGGGQPKWRADGKELFYVAPDGRLTAVGVKASTDRLDVTLPVALFGGVIAAPTWDRYAPTRDGQRFLVVVPTGGGDRQLNVLTNWTSLLEKR